MAFYVIDDKDGYSFQIPLTALKSSKDQRIRIVNRTAVRGRQTPNDLNAKELAKKMISDIFRETGITATAGIKAELLIDHAWGWEPCTMELVKAYGRK